MFGEFSLHGSETGLCLAVLSQWISIFPTKWRVNGRNKVGIEHQPGIRLGLQVIRHDNFPFFFVFWVTGRMTCFQKKNVLPCSAYIGWIWGNFFAKMTYIVPSTTASIQTFESCTMYATILWASRSISLDSASLPHGSPGPMCFPSWQPKASPRSHHGEVRRRKRHRVSTVESWVVIQRAFGRTCFP